MEGRNHRQPGIATCSRLRASDCGRQLLRLANPPGGASGLHAKPEGSGIGLQWELHGGDATNVAIERRTGNTGKWERISSEPAGTRFIDAKAKAGVLCYRVRAINKSGESAFSNIARVTR